MDSIEMQQRRSYVYMDSEIPNSVYSLIGCVELKRAVAHQSDSNYPWNICRAPPKLRRLHHEHGFHPTLIAIGPLNYKKPHLMPMEAHKLRFLISFLDNMTLPHPDIQNQNGNLGKAVVEEIVSQQQLSDQNGNSGKAVVEEIVSQHQFSDQNGASSSNTNDYAKKIDYLAAAMTKLEAYTRDCYSEKFYVDSDEFVTMMIIDSCFVVELLRLYAKKGSEYLKDPIFNTRWVVQSLKHDLIMLENQLPLPVLEKMFEMPTSSNNDPCNSSSDDPCNSSSDGPYTLTDLTLKFFNSLLPREREFFSSGTWKVDKTPNHLLGLFRSSFQVRKSWEDNYDLRSLCGMTIHIRSTDRAPWVHNRKLLIHCVTELKEAGISFKKRENCQLLDIKFKNGKLYIPPILIDDHTGLMFLNFVAYEQCNPLTGSYFTTYLLFLDSLLNSSKDVEHLHSKGIIHHVLGSDEDVAQLFNKLCREVVHDPADCYLSKVLEDVNQYFGKRMHRWRAKWVHDYCSSPWSCISLLAAIVLLLLTAVQAFFAVFSYVNPPS